MDRKLRRLKLACYTGNATMSVVASLSPVLFITFRSLYGFSYSLLGLLVLINFVTQLTVDLIFSFFSDKLPLGTAVRATPILSVLGLLFYAVLPSLMPYAVYPCLLLGTVLFSVSAGMAEVLTSDNVSMTFPYIPVYTQLFEFFFYLMYKYPYVYALAGMTLWLFCPNRRVK